MQQVTVHVPDNKIAFFIDLATNLGFKVDNNIREQVLTERQIELVNEARKMVVEQPDSFADWEEVHKQLSAR